MTNIQVNPKILDKDGAIRKLRSDEELITENNVLTIKRKRKKKTVEKAARKPKKAPEKKSVEIDQKPIETPPEKPTEQEHPFLAASRRNNSETGWIQGGDPEHNYGKSGGPVKAKGENKFIEEISKYEYGGEERDKEIDKKLFSGKLTPRRPPVELEEVVCFSCRKVESVSPVLVKRDRPYLCNTCLTRQAGERRRER